MLRDSDTRNSQKSSYPFSLSVVSDSLRPRGLQHTRLPCHHQLPELAQTHVYWVSDAIQPYHPLSCPSLPAFTHSAFNPPASGSFPLSQLFTSGGQMIGASASALVLPVNIQNWFPLGWAGLISLQSKGFSSLFQYHSSKASILWHSGFFTVQLSHPYMSTGKTIALTRWTWA